MARLRKYNIGYTGISEDSSKYEIIKIINHKRVVVKFDTGNTKEVDLSQLVRGKVKNYYTPSVLGIGVPGDKYSPKSLEYSVWTHYIKKHINKEIILCDEWLYLDNFAPFIKGWQSMKSKLVCEGNYYSPNTCKVELDSTVKICKHCGKEFYKKTGAVCCSEECAKNIQKERIKSRLTNDYFEKLYKKFDSELECRIRLIDESKFVSVKHGADLVCLECGHERYMPKVYNLYQQGKFGCPNCAKKHREKEQIEKIRICNQCNKEYALKKGETSKFCSKECKDKSKLVIKKCEICKKDFEGNRILKYCSDKCRNEAKSIKAKEKRIIELEIKKAEFIPETKICKCCGGEFQTKYGQYKTVSYCSEMCKKTIQNRRKDQARYKRMRKNGVFDTDISLEKLIKRDSNICGVCGKECDKNDFSKTEEGYFITGDNYPSIDHIHPISKGGTHTWDNVQLTHFRCNTLKNNIVGDNYGD